MKNYLLILIFFTGMLQVFSQSFEVENLKFSGNDDNRINIVILSEGYQASELDKFKTDATNFVNDMFSQSPFVEYTNYFNVYIIKVPSNESGADHPGTATDVSEPAEPVIEVDTYFNATFDAFGYHRSLYYGINYFDAVTADAKIRSVLASNFPNYDQALLLVNTNIYGGTGGEFSIASTHASSSEICIHELGHSLFNLKDEYLLPDVYYSEAINMTQESNTSLVKWKNWVGTNNTGVYRHGTSGVPSNWYRPHQACKMRYLGYAFCPVCKEGIVAKIHDLVSPIDAYTPNQNSIEATEFPLEFTLDLVDPNPNTLTRTWTLNDVEFYTDVDDVNLEASDLTEGENTLTAMVFDDTNFIRIDNYETINAHSVSWTINYSTLGVEKIETKENSFNIEMYPNPTENTINFTFKNRNNSILKIEIATIDGKIINSISVANLETQSIDISPLQSGIYLANFYTDNAFVGSKKIVKQ